MTQLATFTLGWPVFAGVAGTFGIVAAAFLLLSVHLRKAEAKIRRLQASRKILAERNDAVEAQLVAMMATQGDIIRRTRVNQLGKLVATVAHEIRNPMGSLRISAYLLKRKLPAVPEDCLSLFTRMESGINRCDAIITQLLDYSSDASPNLAADDINAWMGQLLLEQASKVPEGVTLRLSLDEAPLEVQFDHLRLRRAVLNLISNAVEAVAPKVQDGSAAEINVDVAMTARGVEIEVRDNGPGIPADVLERVGEPLFSTKSFGTGLGVASSRKVAELHGGALELYSDATGTRAVIWFPQVKSALLAA